MRTMRFPFVAGTAVFAAMLSGLGVQVAADATSTPAPDDPETIVLPSLTVEDTADLPKPESWRYARIDGFEVLADVSEAQANLLLQDLERYRQALHIARPALARPDLPATLLLCARRGAFETMLSERERSFAGVVSVLQRDAVQVAIAVDLETRELYPADGSLWRASGRGSYSGLAVEPQRQLHRQYARLLMRRENAPPWLIEGLVQIAMDLEFTDRVIRYGSLDASRGASLAPALADGLQEGQHLDILSSPDGSPGSSVMSAGTMFSDLSRSRPDGDGPDGLISDRPFPLALARKRLMPLDTLFAMPADAPSVIDPLENSLWSKQACAFVHLCLFGADGKYRAAFDTLVRRLSEEPLTEAVFLECFGKSYAEMLRELGSYVDGERFRFRQLELAEEGRLKAVDLVFREATQGEIARIKGDAQRLAGRHAEALRTYRVAYARGERDPALLAALGVAELHAGSIERGRAFLESAARLGTDRPTAWIALARLRLDEAKARAGESGTLPAAQVAAVLAPLLKARALKPALPETYRLMADLWESSAVSPTPANMHLLGAGVMQFPSDSDLALRTARLYLRAGDARNASGVAGLGLRSATDPAARARLDEFLSRLPAPQGSAPVSDSPPAASTASSPKAP